MSRRLIIFLVFFSLISLVSFRPLALADNQPQRVYHNSLEAAEGALARGEFEFAITAFQSALMTQPNNPRIRFGLGKSLFSLSRTQEAFAQFQGVLEKQPGNFQARFELAKCLVKMNDTTEARKHLEWLVKAQPSNEAARVLLSSLGKPAIIIEAGNPGKPGAWKKTGEPSSPVVMSQMAPAARPAIILDVPQNPAIANAPVPAKAAAAAQDGEIWISGPKGGAATPAPTMPSPNLSIQGWRVSDFLAMASDSYGVSLEYAKYCLEKGDLAMAAKTLDQALETAEKNPKGSPKGSRTLEILLQKCLVSLYTADIKQFGQHLMRLKPMLSKATLNSFLDVYNKAAGTTSPVEIARIVGGVALGAEHFAVAVKILSEVVGANPGDTLALRLLAQAQLEARDLGGAERSFLQLVKLSPNDPEVHFNLSRFYLTARFLPAHSRAYSQATLRLNSSDERAKVMLLLADFFEGQGTQIQDDLKRVIPTIKDQSLSKMAKRILAFCTGPNGGSNHKQTLARELALPGSDLSGAFGLTKFGEDLLKRGSYFSALKCFLESRNLSEIGRVYLAMASNLASSGDEKGATIATSFGLNALNQELKVHPQSERAHLYLALYYFERNDQAAARRHIEAGLSVTTGQDVKRNLLALKGQLG